MTEFVENLHEVFASFGTLSTRRMFGGVGVYHDGLMFGLVADDELYLKADNQSASLFVDRGLAPFRYWRNGKTLQMSYYRAPDVVFDDAEQAREWAVRAYEAACRAGKSRR